MATAMAMVGSASSPPLWAGNEWRPILGTLVNARILPPPLSAKESLLLLSQWIRLPRNNLHITHATNSWLQPGKVKDGQTRPWRAKAQAFVQLCFCKRQRKRKKTYAFISGWVRWFSGGEAGPGSLEPAVACKRFYCSMWEFFCFCACKTEMVESRCFYLPPLVEATSKLELAWSFGARSC